MEAGKTGGGGAMMAPPLEISAVDRAIAVKISTMVVCDVIYKVVYLDFPKYFYFILINYANLCKKSDFLL